MRPRQSDIEDARPLAVDGDRGGRVSDHRLQLLFHLSNLLHKEIPEHARVFALGDSRVGEHLENLGRFAGGSGHAADDAHHQGCVHPHWAVERAAATESAFAKGNLCHPLKRRFVQFFSVDPGREKAADKVVLLAIDLAQLFRAIRRDMLQFRLGYVIVAGFRAYPAPCTHFERGGERSVQLLFEHLQCSRRGVSFHGRPPVPGRCRGDRYGRRKTADQSKSICNAESC